jgi:hypothetical protein
MSTPTKAATRAAAYLVDTGRVDKRFTVEEVAYCIDREACVADLLVACKTMLKLVDTAACDPGHVWLNAPHKPEQTPITMLKAVIAKAEGKRP